MEQSPDIDANSIDRPAPQDSGSAAGESRHPSKVLTPATGTDSEAMLLGGAKAPLHRRNSQLAVEFLEQQIVVRKTYHAEYTAQDEHQAYLKLAELCQGNRVVRLPEIFGLDVATNTIHVEYIPGNDLRRSIQQHGFDALVPYEAALMDLFLAARAEGHRFDSDPANFICGHDQELVLVDPLCQQIDLPDFVFVVFLFGLFKASFAKPLRPRTRQYLRLLNRYCRTYCDRRKEVDPAEIYLQMSKYAQQVVAWNREAAPGESLALKCQRRLIWIPAVNSFRAWLSWRARRPA